MPAVVPTPGKSLSLRLFIAGGTASAHRAIDNRTRLLAALADDVEITIVDVLTNPGDAEAAGIVATPTLSDDSVTPPRRVIGDISDVDQIIDFFGCRRKEYQA
jgi:circadian clock protein KaiB